MPESHLVKNRCVQIIDADSVDQRLVADLVGFTEKSPPFYTATCKPGRKGMRVMIPACSTLLHQWKSTEFTTPDHQSFVEHSSLGEVGQ